jgi:hypothetical protein
MFISAFDPFLRNKIEAQLTAVTMDKLVQGCVARWPVGRVAKLEDMLGRVLRAEPEGMRCPGLNRANASAGRKLVFRSLVQIMDRRLDAVAPGDVHPPAMFQAMNGFVALAMDGFFGFVDEDEGFRHDLDLPAGKRIVKLAYGRRRGNPHFDDPWAAVGLDEDDLF